jgi:hypothetical protein
VEPLKTLIALALASTVTTAYGARLARLDCEMRQRLTQSGRANVVDVAHVAANVRRLRRWLGERIWSQVFGYRIGSESFQFHSQHEYRHARRRNSGSHVEQKRRYAGPTDESWSRALDWLVDCYLLAPGTGVF